MSEQQAILQAHALAARSSLHSTYTAVRITEHGWAVRCDYTNPVSGERGQSLYLHQFRLDAPQVAR